jgi:hypothetical protein
MTIVDALDPNSGPATGGTPVRVIGSGMLDVTDVGIGGSSVTDLALLSDDELEVITPSGTGTVDVTLVLADGSDVTATDAFTYELHGTETPTFFGVSVESVEQVWDSGRAIHSISATPAMPTLTVYAPLRGVADDATTERRFRMGIVYDDGSRHDETWIPESGWAIIAGPVWAPDIGSVFAGGDVFVEVEYDTDAGMTISAQLASGTHLILGQNPDKDEVRGMAADNASYTVVFHRESRFTQFKDGPGIANQFVAGCHGPLRGEDPGKTTVGYGIGQLTTPPPTSDQLWNWTANLGAALDLLQVLRIDAVAYQQQVQTGAPWDTQTGGQAPNEGIAYPTAPDFTGDELDLEMWARYNGGYRYHNYDPIAGSWIRRLPAGQGAGTSLPYAEALAKLKAQVLAGNPPAGW